MAGRLEGLRAVVNEPMISWVLQLLIFSAKREQRYWLTGVIH